MTPLPSEKGCPSVVNGVPVPPARGTTVPRKMGTPPSEEGYPFLDDGIHVSRKIVSLAVPRRRVSPPSQSGSRPRVGGPRPGKRDSRPSEMGILVPRKWGYPSFRKGLSVPGVRGNPQSVAGVPVPWKRARIQGNTGARHSETWRPSLGRVALDPRKRGSLPGGNGFPSPRKKGPFTLQMRTRATEEGDRAGPRKGGSPAPRMRDTRASEKAIRSSVRGGRNS